MSDDEGHHKSFEEAVRAIADEIRRSVEHASQADPDEIARAAGVDPDRVREWVDNAGEWLRAQLEGAAGGPSGGPAAGTHARPGPARPPGEDLLRGAGPHPLDVPTAEQGIALAALDSGRWTIEPGTSALSAHGGGPGPRDALGLVRELRVRDWIDADGVVTLVGRHALGRWLAAAERG
jgi:hypothetical protein